MPKANSFEEMVTITRENAAENVSKSERIRLERWIEKLEESDYLNRVWSKDRMEYMKLLMHQVVNIKQLSIPFHSTPPDGILPRFPAHLSTRMQTKTSVVLVDPEKVKFWRGINTKMKTPRETNNSTTAAAATATLKVQQLEAEIRNEKIQQCHQLHQLAAVHTYELTTAGTRDGQDTTRSNNQPSSTINNHPPFFGSAVSSSSSNTTTSVGQSAAAALIAATGIDAALASIHDLETEMDYGNDKHVFFGDDSTKSRQEGSSSSSSSSSSSKRSLNDTTNATLPANRVLPDSLQHKYQPEDSLSQTMNRHSNTKHGDLPYSRPTDPPPFRYPLHDSNNISTHQPPTSSALHITSDEEFLLYLNKFQTELEC